MSDKRAAELIDTTSDDECVISDFGERVAAVECERRKLKNKLVELQEEKKIKDELLRELYYLKDAANTASVDAQLQRTKEKKRKLCQIPAHSQHVTKASPTEDSQNTILDSDIPGSQLGSRHSHPSASLKHDNVRKEQNPSFPARRHYEAEGRANEDSDIPAVPAPVAVPTAADNPEIKEKIRKLKVAQEHVKVIKDIVVSILESRKSRRLLPADQLRILAPMKREDKYFSDEESEADSEFERELSSTIHLGNSEPAATNVKEVCCDGLRQLALDADSLVSSYKQEEEVTSENLETSVMKKEVLTKLQSQFQQLMQIFPSSDRINDDHVRSSGEGAYSQKKNPVKTVATENVQKIHLERAAPVPHQDNLQLTRQNIVSMESQSQNSNSNLQNRDCNSVKKDNINNLSGKMGKLSIQNSMNSSYPDVLTASNNNMDTVSTFSYEMNQNHSLQNEIERKTILDILKRDKKKQKQYDRNQDCHVCCNSSVDSEPLEGPNSALAIDTTLAAWGGSSTQENFEDENEEQAESLVEHDDEAESSLGGHRAARYPRQYSNMQHYIESVANIPDKRQRNFQHPVYNSNQNQPAMQARYHQHSAQAVKSRQPIPSSTPTVRSGRENPPCVNDSAEHYPQQFPSKFVQQLSNHVDQLYNLCQNQMSNDRPQAAMNSNSSQSSPFQASPEIPLPYNQQLLLCLSQCYHALYMQQLEIHQLQRCIWQNIHLEHSQVQNSHEDTSFRPYAVTPLELQMQNRFPPDEISPLSTYFPLQHMKPYPNHGVPYGLPHIATVTQPARAVIHPTSQNNAPSQDTLNNQNIHAENSHQRSNQNTRNTHEDASFRPYGVPPLNDPQNRFLPDEISPLSAYFQLHNGGPFVTSSATQPARAVIHPTSQNNASSQETLNNQVPPRTRANNFWDNFRSYSRQNLLSTSNNAKRNETAASLVTPQVRQVYPLVTHGSPNRATDTSNTHSISTFSENDRPAPNPEDTTKNSKFNVSSATASNFITYQKKDAAANISCAARKTVATRSNSEWKIGPSWRQPAMNLSNTNSSQSHPSDNTKGSLASIPPSSLSHSSPEASGIIQCEIPTSIPPTEPKSDFLIGLFHEAQALKSEALRQKALKMLKDLARSEILESDDASQIKVQNEPSHSAAEFERGPNQRCFKLPVETAAMSPEHSDYEKTVCQVPSDNVSGNIQNLPTAAIPPLSKHGTPRTVSTGAVRKRPKFLSSCFSEPISNGVAPSERSQDPCGSAADSADPSQVVPHKSVEDIPGFITEKVISDLVSMLPSLKRRVTREPQPFLTYINDCLIESLRTHFFFCNISLSRKSLTYLQQTVCLFLSLFAGIMPSDIDSDFVKYVEEFIYENVTCFIASGRFAPLPASPDEKFPLDFGKYSEEKIEPLSIKMPVRVPDETIEPTNIKRMPLELVDTIILKMPSEETISFSSQVQCGTASQQNVYGFDNFISEPCTIDSPEHPPCMDSPEHAPHMDSPEHSDLEPELGPVDDEPEVEIGTEADLAEADQSPGQQGAVGDTVPAPETWSLDHEAIIIHRCPGTGLMINDDSMNDKDIEDSSEGATCAPELCPDLDQEAIFFDDIPTKLSATEEELPQQLRDEQPLPDLPSDGVILRDFGSENVDGASADIK